MVVFFHKFNVKTSCGLLISIIENPCFKFTLLNNLILFKFTICLKFPHDDVGINLRSMHFTLRYPDIGYKRSGPRVGANTDL